MNFRTTLRAGALIWLMAGALVAAEEPEATLDRARALLAAGRTAEAVRMLEEALLVLSARMPLSFRTVEFVETVESYGRYSLRETNTYLPNDEIRLYVEPVGFVHDRGEGEKYRVEFTADFELRLSTGQVILGKDSFARFPFESLRPSREFYLLITYSFEGLRPGDYTLVTRLHDVTSGKSGSFAKAVRIIAPPEPTPTAARPGG